jgi:hypothetical protein
MAETRALSALKLVASLVGAPLTRREVPLVLSKARCNYTDIALATIPNPALS